MWEQRKQVSERLGVCGVEDVGEAEGRQQRSASGVFGCSQSECFPVGRQLGFAAVGFERPCKEERECVWRRDRAMGHGSGRGRRQIFVSTAWPLWTPSLKPWFACSIAWAIQ
jgi:hypothetical protein